MNITGWKYIFASVVGTSHTTIGGPCQDEGVCVLLDTTDGSQVLVAVVADGAGSASRAELGSALACSLFVSEMHDLFESGGAVKDIDREFAQHWLTRLQNEIAVRAQEEALTSRDFACTVLAAVVGNDCAAFMQIGDGAIVIPDADEPDNYGWVFWPQQGQYANQTNFATDPNAQDKIDYCLISHPVHELAVFTDGLQGLALHYQSQQAHAPFFRPIFEWLRVATDGHSEKLSESLSAFLDSKKVNDSTDDDKTIVLATRLTPPAVSEPGDASPEQTTGL